MSEPAWVVAWDVGERGPRSGQVVVHPADAEQLRRRTNALLLPIDLEAIQDPPNGASGWVRRDFGSGVAPSWPVPSRVCPLAIWATPEAEFVHWAIEIVVTDPNSLAGVLRVASDTSQRGTISPLSEGSSACINLDAKHQEFMRGEFVATGGVQRAQPSIEGLLGLAIYGAARGVRITRFAVSVCARES